MVVLVVGASGFLGAHVYRVLKTRGPRVEVLGTYGMRRTCRELVHVDLTSTTSVKDVLRQVRPDVIVWCAMSHPPDFDEDRIHDGGLRAVIEYAPNKRLVFVSTDGVLPGIQGPYRESVQPALIDANTPIARYTNAKLCAEQVIARFVEDHCIVRVGPIYGRTVEGNWHRRVQDHLAILTTGQPFSRPSNMLRTYINVEDLALALARLVISDFAGILHVGPQTLESHFTFARNIATAFGYPVDLVRPSVVSPDEVRERAVRLDTTMDTQRAVRVLGVHFRGILEALSEKAAFAD